MLLRTRKNDSSGLIAALGRLAALTALALAGAAHAADFQFDVDSPKLRISIPGVPAMKMQVHPLNAKQPHVRFFGNSGAYTVSVFTPAAAAGMTALECASAIARTLQSRPGVPAPSQVYKRKLNDSTFLAIYASPSMGLVHLHAHLMSAAGGKHCAEVHVAKVSETPEDLDPWFEGFAGAKIEAR
jgi:hypothetical protein